MSTFSVLHKPFLSLFRAASLGHPRTFFGNKIPNRVHWFIGSLVRHYFPLESLFTVHHNQFLPTLMLGVDDNPQLRTHDKSQRSAPQHSLHFYLPFGKFGRKMTVVKLEVQNSLWKNREFLRRVDCPCQRHCRPLSRRVVISGNCGLFPELWKLPNPLSVKFRSSGKSPNVRLCTNLSHGLIPF